MTNTNSHVEKRRSREVHMEDERIISYGSTKLSHRMSGIDLASSSSTLAALCLHHFTQQHHTEQETVSLVSVRTLFFFLPTKPESVIIVEFHRWPWATELSRS